MIFNTNSGTVTVNSPEVEKGYQSLFTKEIILYNDNVNHFDHVISCLIDFCNHHPLQAEQCAMLVHYNGKCSIKSGKLNELKPIYEALLENHLTVEIR
jgi:ATP-dependent Clp protease adaptor protein ClpS